MDHIETPEEVGFPLLGYHVITKLKGVEVNEAVLLSILSSIGLERYMPGLPEPVTILQRAVRRWLREISKADINIADEEKILLRRISSSKSDIIALGLVVERKDLIEWGLDYLTNLRIFYDKENGALSLRCTGTGSDVLAPHMNGADRSLLSQLEPHWTYYKKTYMASDLSRMATDMVKDLDSANLKDRSGSYFIPVDKLVELSVIKELIEEKLSADSENTSTLSAFPMIDRPQTRKQLANLAYQSLMAELLALDKKLQSFVKTAERTTGKGKPGKVRKDSVLSQLSEYKDMKTKILLYKEKLGVQQEELFEKLSGLKETAQKLIDIEVEA
jgi:hypothetical protein